MKTFALQSLIDLNKFVCSCEPMLFLMLIFTCWLI